MTNRVDELESRIDALEATIDGLTDELVETKDRLRALEPSSAPADETDGGRIETEVTDGGEDTTDDIIVA